MKPITINAFLGASSAVDDTLLPAGVGVTSLNQRPGYGDMRPWNAPGSAVATVPSSPQQQTLHRLSQGVSGDATYWLSWSAVVNAVPGFDANDTTERTYFTGSGTPKATNNVIGLSGGPPYPQSAIELGVPAPAVPLTAVINTAATEGDEQAFSWVYTFVNAVEWESAPSPISTSLLAKPGTTFDLSGFAAAPSGAYLITKVRLYRYVPGTESSGSYFFLREFLVGVPPANPIDDARAVGSDPVATVGWRPCPGIPNGGALNTLEATAFGMTRLWNGMLAVLTGRAMRICEPYHQYAWPLAYEIAITDEPIAIGVWGQRAIVLTSGDAVLVAGSSPDSMDDEPAAINRPCSSARSVVSFNEGDTAKGVVWASEQGLCWYGDGGFRLLTKNLLTSEQWKALVPSTMVASRLDRFYLCFYNDGTRKGFVIDPMEPTGMYYLSTGYHAVYRDPRTDQVYVLDGANIRRWGAGSALTATFRSKLLRQPTPFNVGAIEVIAKGYPVNVKLYGDGVLRLTQDAPSDDTLRPPGGWEADELQLEVISSSRVIAVRLARNPDDLREP